MTESDIYQQTMITSYELLVQLNFFNFYGEQDPTDLRQGTIFLFFLAMILAVAKKTGEEKGWGHGGPTG